ncbi:MAG: hypothetical protein AAGH92_07075 [Planctomycetota bacterium]
MSEPGSESVGRLKLLDAVLRGDATRAEALDGGEVPVSARALVPAVLGLGVVYGLCMGSFGLIRAYTGTGLGDTVREGVVSDAWWQLLAAAVKVPVLFAATLVVTLPSLYVFNALVGSRLSARSVFRLLTAMLGVALAVLASLGPIVAFFGVSTTSYPFMLLLNVACFAVAGSLGLAFLLRTLRALVHHTEALVPPLQEAEATDAEVSEADAGDNATTSEESAESTADFTPIPRPSRPGVASPSSSDDRAKAVFRVWIVVFAFVGVQMSWVLRPFIGSPDLPFAWFRAREGNFFTAVFRALQNLLGAG